MPTVAEQLSAAREKRNLSISQVASLTNIKSDHIRALEEGDYDVFSAPIYIRGFVRSIGKTLKMNMQDLMAQLDAELAATKNFREPPSLTVGPKSPLDRAMYFLSKVHWKLVLPIVVVVILIWISYTALRGTSSSPPEESRPIQIGPGMYDDSQDSGEGETLKIPEP